MNFKNTIKLIFLIPFFVFSCKSLDIITQKEIQTINYQDVIENTSNIYLNTFYKNNLNSQDSYDELQILNWTKTNYKKIKTLDTFGKKYVESNPILKIIIDNELIFVNHKNELIIYDLNDYKIIKKINLDLQIKDKDVYPTSLAQISDFFILSLSNGKIFSFNLDGSIIWQRNFNDILKTPIKIFDENIIIVLSNKIISLNHINGNNNWEFLLDNSNPLKVLGGDIVSLNHYLFVLLPNNNFVMIDTIMGDMVNTEYHKYFKDNQTSGSSDQIHSFNNLISYFGQSNYLTTIDIDKQTILLNNKKILNVNSFRFYNNSLITLNNDSLLKAYNISNNKLFWQIDISDKVKKNESIVDIANYNNSLIIFFESGLILELNSINGKIISEDNLKLKNIISIKNQNEYLLIDQINSKTSIFIK